MTKRIALFFALLLMACVTLQAQSAFKVTVRLTDSASGEPVGFATVSLTRDGATSPSSYALGDSEGHAHLDKVRAGKYTIKAELMGYKAHTQAIEVKGDLDLGEVKMDPDQRVLDAASVSAVGNPITIKKDTVEYNASSYKISDNDMLENLLQKLPGVEVSEDGTVTANGETITKITIDGKTFFLDDPTLATKNIPAKIVEKVKVVKKKSEQAEFTGIDDGQEEYVIDLSVQKGMMNGVFGNAMLGGGHDVPQSGLSWKDGDYRYQGALMVGKFTDKSQISLIANGNNTNNRGFNDLSGSMMQNMRGSGGMGRGQGGWGSGNGITTSWMGGLNGSWDLFDDKMSLGGNYLYNNTDRFVEETSLKETYLDDNSTLVYNNTGFNSTYSDGHRLGFRLEHKFSENTSLLIQPQLNFGTGNFNEFSQFSTDTRTGTLTEQTNRGFSSTTGDNDNITTNGFALFRQRLGLPGRTVSLMTNWNFSGNNSHGFNQSLTETFDGADPSIINQRYKQTQTGRSLSARLVYTEPLGAGFYLEGNYSYSWTKNSSRKDTYDSGELTGTFDETTHPYNYTGEAHNQVYSNSIDNKAISQSAGINLAYQEGKTRAQAGISVNPTHTVNTTIDGVRDPQEYDSKVVNWAPQAMVFYDFNDNSNIRLFYRGRSSQPSTSQLMAVMDNSNPLALSFGNPGLTPYFSHSLRSEFGHSNKQTFFSFNGNMELSMVQNPIVSALWYDNTGVQYTMPVNGDNTLNGNIRWFVNYPIARSNFSLTWNNRIGYSKSNSFVGASRLDMSGYFNEDGSVKDYKAFVDAFSNLEDNGDFIKNVTESLSIIERLRITYRTNNLELTASGRMRVSKPWYTINSTSQNTTWSNQLQTTGNWTLNSAGLTLKADLNYNWYKGYTSEREPEYILNAEIQKLILKGSATLALKCYDVLNQAKNLSVTDASNYHQETYNNTLGRYVILSFTWRFGNFGKARDRMNARFQRGGMPPMGGGMGRPF